MGCFVSEQSEEIGILNTMPINKQAKKALQDIGEEVLTGSLHCMQLALYFLVRGEIEAEEDLVQTIRAMTTWRAQRIMNFLMLVEEEVYNPPGWEDAENYRELARIIIEDIENKMVKHFPWYRTGESY